MASLVACRLNHCRLYSRLALSFRYGLSQFRSFLLYFEYVSFRGAYFVSFIAQFMRISEYFINRKLSISTAQR